MSAEQKFEVIDDHGELTAYSATNPKRKIFFMYEFASRFSVLKQLFINTSCNICEALFKMVVRELCPSTHSLCMNPKCWK